jgi:hypothetical protein
MRLGAVLLGSALGVPAAQAATTDLVVHCDPPMAGPLRAVAAGFLARTGVRVRIFATVPNGIPAQLAREIQNDIVVTQPFVLAQIEALNLLADAPRPGPWRVRMVVARREGGRPPPVGEAVLAAPDPGWGGGPDGPAVLAGAGLRPRRVQGTFDTAEAAALLRGGEVDYALLHAAELGDGFEDAGAPGLVMELTYFAALTKSTRRPNPEALLRFLATPEAGGILRGAHLEGAA